MSDPVDVAASYQRELLGYCDEFFRRATGKDARSFASIGSFAETVRANALQIGPRGFDAFSWFVPTVREFYAKRAGEAFDAAKRLGGHKLVLGGGSRFMGSQLDAVAVTSLYSDTVFVPDPVMPWVEKERDEEIFARVLLLEAVHALLHLRPLVMAKVPYPAVVVFPSWEKILEGNDETTRRGQQALVTAVFSDILERPFGSIEELMQEADRDPTRFLTAVESKQAFIAPGGQEGEPIERSLASYVEYLRENRSERWVSMFETLPVQRKVLMAIWERVSPHYHLLENAEEMRGHPLVAVEQQARYFKLVCSASGSRLQDLGLLEPRIRVTVEALSHERLTWMRGIPLESIARLKEDGATSEFRSRLGSAVARLHDTVLEDVSHVADEVCHELSDMITLHDRQQRELRHKYDRAHANTLALGIAGASVSFAPALAPLFGTTSMFAVAAKYGKDKWEESADKRSLSRSLIGVLATARAKTT